MTLEVQTPEAKRRLPKLSFAVLGIRNFRLLLLARAFNAMALQAQAVIVGWQIYSLTHDVFLLGLTGLVEAVPAIGCALFAGHVVDNTPPKRVYVICAAILMVNVYMLLLLAGNIVSIPHQYLLYAIYGGVFVSGVARAFTAPVVFSLAPDLVPRSQLTASSAWLSSGFQMASIAGPAIAGLLFAGFGARGAWVFPTVMITLAFLAGLFLNPPAKGKQIGAREPVWRSIKAGWQFIWHSPVLLSVMTLDMFAVLFGGATAMLPAYADQILHVGAQGLGALRAAPAFGAVASALVLAVMPMRTISARMMLWIVAGFGLCMIGFGFSTAFWLSILFLGISGVLDSISVVIRVTLRQLLTPDQMRGRVSSINSMFVSSSNEIGAFESGIAANLLGLMPSVVFGGCMTLLVAAITAWRAPSLRQTVIRTDEND